MTKLIKTGLSVCMLIGASALSAADEGYSRNSLEPCMNGEVSASGAFRSDAAEREFVLAEALRAEEPCINAEVPPNGVLGEHRLGQSLEQVLTAGRP